MRDALAIAVWLFVVAIVIVFIGVPVGVFSLLRVKRRSQR